MFSGYLFQSRWLHDFLHFFQLFVIVLSIRLTKERQQVLIAAKQSVPQQVFAKLSKLLVPLDNVLLHHLFLRFVGLTRWYDHIWICFAQVCVQQSEVFIFAAHVSAD